MKETEKKIILWAAERGILFPENSKNQLLKAFEEMGEISRAILINDKQGMKNEIGDVLVTLIIFSHNIGFDLNECLQSAWDKIKDRQGQTINGTFIKKEII